jgi:signal transduction histidine kinase/ligand-binding sensor domain-containing protein
MLKRWLPGALLVWAVLVCAVASDVPSRFTIDVWDTDSGLPQNSVISMIRTADGYLWLGTVNGLVRFDGVGRRMSGGAGMEFPVFDKRNTPGLGSSVIVKLFEDSQGDLWIGTEGGVLRAKGGKVERISIGQGGVESRLMAICEDNRGSVWLYTADGQLGRYSKGKVDVWRSGAEQPSQSRHLIVDDSNLVWVGTDRAMVALGPMTEAGGGALAVAHELPVGKLDFILASGSGGYWRLANGRIQKWKRDRLDRDLGAYPWNTGTTPVFAACEDAAGNLVIGTGGQGVFWFDARGDFTQLTVTNGLSNSTILSLCFDKEGNLWVGTDGGGLNRARAQVFKVIEASRDQVVRSVSGDTEGGVWIGYSMPGYKMGRIDHWKSGGVTTFSSTHGLIDLNVRCVFAERSGQVWAGTQGKSLLRFSGGLFLQAREAGIYRDVSALFEDSKGRIWAGTSDGAACRSDQGWRLFTTREGLGANFVRAFAEDDRGGIWVGTEGGGLSRLADGERVEAKGATGLVGGGLPAISPAESVSCLLWGSDKALWAGTSEGLARLTAGGWTFFTNRAGLSTPNISYLVEDDQGYLWVGSSLGLMRAPKDSLIRFAGGKAQEIPLRFYGKPDGLPTREVSQGSQPAAWKGRDGALWFSTIKGLVTVNPSAITRNTNPPPVIIEAVAVDERVVTSAALRIPAPDRITIPAGRENLDIFFTSLNLSAPEQGQFRYQLEGFERGWTVIPGNLRSVHYSRLPHGDYVFRIAACNEDGVWNLAGSSVAIQVLPPFWRTWWFLTLAAILALGAVVGSVHYVSTQRLQRQLAAMRQHEAIERERARIARDLHDQLGANLTQVALLGELAESDKDEPAEVESHARQISQTARETTHALDEIVWTVNPSNDTLEGLGNYICKCAQDYLGTADIKCRLDVPAQLPSTPIPPELRHNVFLVAKEAINNIVKHSGATEARLRLVVERDRFSLEIEDNGKGLSPDAERKGRNGLKNMRKRMEDAGGTFDIQSSEGCGTKTRLSAPRPPN